MLHYVVALPLSAPAAALADGRSGSLDANVVDASKVREGSLPLNRLTTVAGGSIIGRMPGSSGAPRALDGQEVQDILDAGTNVVRRSSLVQATAKTLPIGAQALVLEGYYAPGDAGAALYTRVAGEPTHPGKFQSADGTWWELGMSTAPLEVFGAAGDGATDDRLAFEAAASWSVATGGLILGQPRATYLLSDTASLPGGRFHGRGARIRYVGGINTPVLDFGEAPAVNCEVVGWVVTTASVSSYFITATRTRGLLVEDNQLGIGCLLWVDLSTSSRGLTGAKWNPARPDPRTIVESDLNLGVVVRGNRCTSDGSGPDHNGNLAVIRLRYVNGCRISGNEIRSYHGETIRPGSPVSRLVISGIVWSGGDANPGRDGGLRSIRWARDISIIGNVVDGVSSGGIWGSQGRDVTCTGNVVKQCGDIGIHGEGSDGITVTGNTMRNCKNGGFSPFFVEERAVYANNSVVIEDASTWGVTLLRQNMPSAGADFSITVEGNIFEMADPAATGEVRATRGGRVLFKGNELIDCNINFLSVNSGDRVIENNSLIFRRDPNAPAIQAGLSRHSDSERQAGISIAGNLIEAVGWDGSGLTAAIYVKLSGVNKFSRPFATIVSNRIYGWRDSAVGYEKKGFPIDIVTECGGDGIADIKIIENHLWQAKVLDRTHYEASVAPDAYRQRIFHRNNMSSDPEQMMPYVGTPTNGVFLPGSRGEFMNPSGGTDAGWVVAGGFVAGAHGGAWTSGRTYSAGEQVLGEDGKVYLAVTDSSGIDPTMDMGERWARVAPVAAIFRGMPTNPI